MGLLGGVFDFLSHSGINQETIEHGLDRAVRTNRRVLAACTLGLLAVLALLSLTADGTTRDAVGLLGLGGVVASFGVMTLDAWRPLPRPAPRTVTCGGAGATQLKAATSAFLALVLVAAGVTLIAVSFLLAPSLESVSEGRRGGAGVYFVVVAAPALLGGTVALMVRRDQVLLTPEGLTVRRVGRERSARWDAVRQVEPVPGNPGLVLRIGVVDGPALMVTTRQLDLSLGELTAVVGHLAAHPGDRVQLGTADGPTLVEGLRRGVGHT